MNFGRSLIASAVAVGTLMSATPFAANAQSKFLHKHSTAASVGAGLIAHHEAKKAGRARVASGRKPNFAERHPTLSAAAAGGLTHHMLKRH